MAKPTRDNHDHQAPSTEENELQGPQATEEADKEKAVSIEESHLLDELRRVREEQYQMSREIVRLKAISDENKGRSYDHDARDKRFTGFLRFIDDVSNPIVFWKTLKNISYVDPRTEQLVEDQQFEVRTHDGKSHVMSIHDWNRLRSNQTHFRFLKMDNQNNLADIQLSTDGGQSFVGEVIKDLSMTFVNP